MILNKDTLVQYLYKGRLKEREKLDLIETYIKDRKGHNVHLNRYKTLGTKILYEITYNTAVDYFEEKYIKLKN